MKKTAFYLVVLLFSINISGLSQHANHSLIDESKRKARIEEVIAELRDYSPDETTESLSFQEKIIENGHKYSVRIIEKGFVRLSNTEWVYFISESSHKNPEVGDITLAIDSHGCVFKNYGHVCGGIVHFESYTSGIPQKSHAFFENYECDTDESKWMKL